jgi:biopolymer transport protein ExbB
MPIRQSPFRRNGRIRRASAALFALLLTQVAGRAFAQAVDSGATSPDATVPLTGFARLPHNLSPWNMFTAADIVVQAVMVSLAFASVVTWTILIAKTLELLAARRSLKAGLSVLGSSQTLEQAAVHVHAGRSAVVHLITAALQEAMMSADMPSDGLKERTQSRLERIEAAEGRMLALGTGVLATIGATAPFVGLFGTVWGIMNSFIGISKSQTTNLAVVAPGIAEALLATALGLIAAIPAVVIYNHFARAIAAHKALVADASAEVLRLVSRDSDRRQSAAPTAPARAAQ